MMMTREDYYAQIKEMYVQKYESKDKEIEAEDRRFREYLMLRSDDDDETWTETDWWLRSNNNKRENLQVLSDSSGFNRPDPKPIYEIKADKEIPKASSKSKRRYKLQKRISCEELDERTMKGLCVFCEEPETPGHYLQHTNSCLLMIDSEDHLSDSMVNKIGNEISSDSWLSNSIGCELESGETDNDEDRAPSDSDLVVNDIKKVKEDLVAIDVDSETDLLTENNQQFQEQAKNRFTTSVMQPSLEIEATETKSSAQEIGSSATNNVQVIEWIHEEESEKERKWEDVKQSGSLQSYYDQVKSTELVVRDQTQEIRSDVVYSPWVSVKRDGAVETQTCISRRANHVWKPGGFVHPKIQLDWLERADSNHEKESNKKLNKLKLHQGRKSHKTWMFKYKFDEEDQGILQSSTGWIQEVSAVICFLRRRHLHLNLDGEESELAGRKRNQGLFIRLHNNLKQQRCPKSWMFKFKTDSKSAMTNHILHQEKKPSKSPKSWKFKFKSENLRKMEVLFQHSHGLSNRLHRQDLQDLQQFITFGEVTLQLEHKWKFKGKGREVRKELCHTSRETIQEGSSHCFLLVAAAYLTIPMQFGSEGNHVWHRWKARYSQNFDRVWDPGVSSFFITLRSRFLEGEGFDIGNEMRRVAREKEISCWTRGRS